MKLITLMVQLIDPNYCLRTKGREIYCHKSKVRNSGFCVGGRLLLEDIILIGKPS